MRASSRRRGGSISMSRSPAAAGLTARTAGLQSRRCMTPGNVAGVISTSFSIKPISTPECLGCAAPAAARPRRSRCPGRGPSGFTLLMEALLITMCRAMPIRQVALLLGAGDMRLWRTLDHYVDQARAEEDFSGVTTIGLDETAARRGHNYISLFHDLDAQRLLYACEGRKGEVVAHFAEDLEAHGGCAENVDELCIDMSASYRAGVEEHLPWAEITFDEFHVIQLVNKAVDEVRRQEVKSTPSLRRSRYIWLKDKQAWSHHQINQFHDLKRLNLKTHRAFRIKEALREIFRGADAPPRPNPCSSAGTVGLAAAASSRSNTSPPPSRATTGRHPQRLRFQADQWPRGGRQLAHPGGIVEIPTNSSVPDSVLQALYIMSDHLPVICEVELTVPTSRKEIMPTTLNVEIYPNPTNGNCVISFDKVLNETGIDFDEQLGKGGFEEKYFCRPKSKTRGIEFIRFNQWNILSEHYRGCLLYVEEDHILLK